MQQCSVSHRTGSWRMTIFGLSFRAKPRNQRGAIQERTHDKAQTSLKREFDREIRQTLARNKPVQIERLDLMQLSPLPLRPHARSALRVNSDSSASLLRR